MDIFHFITPLPLDRSVPIKAIDVVVVVPGVEVVLFELVMIMLLLLVY